MSNKKTSWARRSQSAIYKRPGAARILQKLADMGYRTVQMQWWNPEFEPELVAAAVRAPGLPAFPRKTSTQPYGMISSAPCA
ncbi:MAG: hypothetical protein ACLRRT_13285 [Ruthenibacterium lactatiformans]